MRKVVVAVTALLVLGLVGAGGLWWFVWKPVADAERLAQEQISQVQRRVLAVLNDPDSAKFENVTFHAKTNAGCGDVNARNRMGGYVGFVTFVALPNGEVHFGEVEPAFSTTQARIEYLEKELKFVELHIANCPDEKDKAPQESAAK